MEEEGTNCQYQTLKGKLRNTINNFKPINLLSWMKWTDFLKDKTNKAYLRELSLLNP